MLIRERTRMFACEARYWLQSLDKKFSERNKQIIEAAPGHGVCKEIERADVGYITQTFKERLIKKRGAEAATKLFGEMLNQWEAWKQERVNSGESPIVLIIYGGEKYFLSIMGSINT